MCCSIFPIITILKTLILSVLQANIENNDTSSAAITYTITDTDGDLIYDPYELDADNDGCNDVLEAGYTESGVVSGELQGIGYDATTGLVTGNADGYTTPADGDANTVYDFQEAGVAPAISKQPIDVTVSLGGNISFTVTATNADVYQWQIFNGVSWVDLTDTGIHSGATTSILLINNPANSDDGNQYRVLVSSSVFVCQNELSNTAVLIVNVGTLISNRRVTYRVNKN
ncbi:MAG: hypothetical protein COA50_16950 [Flavobacteriaceae bacterium]|nr:MAG: hypothetical protein COA50_16950 [Flavobacteriaceae bacterium]